MTSLFRLITVAATLAVALGGCERESAEHDDHDHGGAVASKENPDDHGALDDDADHARKDVAPADDHDDGERLVRLDDHELSEFGIRLAVARSGVLREAMSLSGEIVLNPDRVAHVVSRADGIGAEVRGTIGDRVEAGDTLAILESPELVESKAAYLAKAAQAALAETDLARAETIHGNTVRLLEIIADDFDVEALRGEISGLDIGANRGELITAYAELLGAEAVYDREKTLFGRQISSEVEYLKAESDLKKALAGFQAVRDDLAFANQRQWDAARRSMLVVNVSLRAAERQLHALGLDQSAVHAVETESDRQLARYEIIAPITGRIIERHLVRGESLGAGDQVFVIADLSSVWGQLTVYQRDLPLVREGQTMRILGAHGLGTIEALIEYVSPILDEKTRTTTARVVLENTEGRWRPGMFVRAELIASEHHATVVVPRSAVHEIDDETVIFIETEEGLESRDVQVGRRDGDSVEILSGLSADQRYVVSGGLALKVELNKAALEHAGHAH